MRLRKEGSLSSAERGQQGDFIRRRNQNHLLIRNERLVDGDANGLREQHVIEVGVGFCQLGSQGCGGGDAVGQRNGGGAKRILQTAKEEDCAWHPLVLALPALGVNPPSR